MIYPALIAILQDIAKDGISKDRKNAQQGYQFRGVDDVMNAFAPLLSAHGVAIIPSFTNRQVSERATKAGGAIFVVTVEGTFRLFAADGSSVDIGPIYGEASDTADKATNKAMAVAFKYALFQAFCVPLEGVTGGDADATTHELAARKPAAPKTDVSPEVLAAREALQAKRKETQVSGKDVATYMRETHGATEPEAWTVAQINDAIAWLNLGAPSKSAPKAVAA